MKRIICISLIFLSISLFSKDKDNSLSLKDKGEWSAVGDSDDSTVSFSVRLGGLEKKYNVYNINMPWGSKIKTESKINTVGGIVHFGKYFIGGDVQVYSDDKIYNKTYGAPHYYYITSNFKPYYIMEPKYANTEKSDAFGSSYYNGYMGIGNHLSNEVPGSLKYDGIGLYAMLGTSVHHTRFTTNTKGIGMEDQEHSTSITAINIKSILTGDNRMTSTTRTYYLDSGMYSIIQNFFILGWGTIISGYIKTVTTRKGYNIETFDTGKLLTAFRWQEEYSRPRHSPSSMIIYGNIGFKMGSYCSIIYRPAYGNTGSEKREFTNNIYLNCSFF